MGSTTSSALTLINNFDIQSISNFNIYILINLFVYSGAITLGALIAIKLLEGFIKLIRYKWVLKYERRSEEIKELNKKIHDRLVEIEEIIESGKESENYNKIKTRLRYNTSRLKKYDKEILKDVDILFNSFSFNDEGDIQIVTSKEQIKELIEAIRERVDKLWFS